MEETTANSAVDIGMHCGRVRERGDVVDAPGFAVCSLVQVRTSWGALSSACEESELHLTARFGKQTYKVVSELKGSCSLELEGRKPCQWSSRLTNRRDQDSVRQVHCHVVEKRAMLCITSRHVENCAVFTW